VARLVVDNQRMASQESTVLNPAITRRGRGATGRLGHAAAAVLLSAAIAVPAMAQVRDQPDLEAIYLIKQEATDNSRVMETLSYLTDVHGPRLTNSPLMHSAARWTQDQLKAWDLTNVRTEAWGPFGRGWVNEHFAATMSAPQPFSLHGYPKAWTPGTTGAVTGDAVFALIDNEADFDKHRGTLRGKFVLHSPMRDLKAYFESPLRRYTDAELQELSKQPVAPGGRRSPQQAAMGAFAGLAEFREKRMQFYKDEGVLAILEMSPGDRGDNGAIRVQGPAPGEGGRTEASEAPLPQIVLSAEHYGRMQRLLEKDIPVTLTLDVRNRFVDDSMDVYNIFAEIPGTDKADEVVMIGAHFDSWHSGTGATDNGVSSAVMMEAMRILKATGLQPRRTIRMALWTGEEQGLLGSRAYVQDHFGDPATMALKPGHEKFSVYFNMDNGGGTFRGVYLQGNEAAAPIFDTWMKPFGNFGMTTATIRSTGGTDHLSFDAVGLPGFQFVQDPLEYSTRTHHTNLDLYERAIPEDLIQNAIVVATFAYQAANREELFPRKPLPKPRQAPQTQTSTR
jgi:carboxypeptidase Q